ncbi:glycoside hydrolase family 28 protein [Bacteroides faecium]|uniref:Glycoside hydrolase family 28 protein n=1 Tax=Bacteroides faecium TaxID=2715212 RepID=A0A6H0KMK9_9BACE|nr:glycoside hydrolase family 28 protein [Bacteroides faecium]QIU94515.1 glycoside hydrolase family 28 protein [Bacteroides faecium]
MNRLIQMAGLVPAILSVLCACQHPAPQAAGTGQDLKAIYADLPFSMPVVERPAFPDYQVNICDFGAKSDGVTLNTEAINNAIKAVHDKGGGRVVIPEGLWLTGPVVLLSNVNLHAENNALVVFSGDTSLYPIITTSFEGLDTKRCQSPISAVNAENIAITGHGVFDGAGDKWRPVKKSKMTEGQWNKLLKSGGKVDESGKVWYPNEGALKASVLMADWGNKRPDIGIEEWEEMKSWLRPVLLSVVKSKKILLEGVTFKNSPSWCLHPLSCESLTLNDVKVFNPWYSQNGDALDVESCKNVLITNCFFDAGDDAICLKSGKDKDGRRRGEPCENVIVRNNTVLHGHGGFVIGSEMSGGVKNVYVSECSFIGTDVGLRFKSARGRGGVVENIYINNINMIDIPNDALIADLYYAVKGAPGEPVPDVTEETPAFRNIHISDVFCKGAGRAVYLNGLPEMPIENISIKNMVVTGAKQGIVINKVAKINIENVDIETPDDSMIQIENATGITINGEEYGTISEKRLLTKN